MVVLECGFLMDIVLCDHYAMVKVLQFSGAKLNQMQFRRSSARLFPKGQIILIWQKCGLEIYCRSCMEIKYS